jgi:hypothetical protein
LKTKLAFFRQQMLLFNKKILKILKILKKILF